MKVYFLILTILAATSISASQPKKKIDIGISLSPAGSFTASSSKIKGKVLVMKNGSIVAKNIRVPIKSLVTGIELRDQHLKKKLGIEKNPRGMLLLVSATGKNQTGKGLFKVLGKTQESPFKYKILSKKYAKASFKLDLTKFDVKGISYMGVGVKKLVDISITLPLKFEK